MRLDLLLDAVEVIDIEGDPATDITDVTYSSDAVRPGSLFCCLPGRVRDGHEFAPAVVAKGASALLVERHIDVERPVAQARVPDARAAMGFASAAFYGHPSRSLAVVGVTGTNGKSTTTHLIKTILDAAGRPCGVIGTMNSARTTPEAPELQAKLASFVDAGDVAAAIEVSSVGLVQRRVEGVEFAASVFTNLSLDELWIHGSIEEYFKAKAMLFDPHRTALAVINADDEWGRRLLAETKEQLATRPFTLADATDLDVRVGGSSFTWRNQRVDLPLDAVFNVMNALAALTVTSELGVDPATAADALSSLEPIAGHSESIDAGQPFRVVVDFAHTAGAIAAVLQAGRAAVTGDGRVVVVFGCGGDRDPGRREPMGEAAAANADVVVVTSDNPRTEDPMAIIEQIATGARRGGPADIRIEPDRRVAIEAALRDARPGDVIVLAGKGHEVGQTIGTQTFPFDDREVARDALRALGYGAARL